MKLQNFLNNKPLFYEKIDYTRMPRVYEKVKSSLCTPKIIHIIGTNGKGTTGRFLANALHSKGFKTGHYTSPHILKFNERIWLNGENATDELLENSHVKLQEILTDADSDSLSYFEYTTLLAMIAFKDCEYVVMEAGLGGERDATAVFPKTLTLVTPIAFDHESFLGSTIELIATTKLNAIQNSAILASQNYDEVYAVAEAMAVKRSLNVLRINELLDDNDKMAVEDISRRLSLGRYLMENLSLSVSALKFLGIKYDIFDFKEAPLFGRLTKISENIIVDVGHNALAALRISEELREDKCVIIYNSYKDKEYKDILTTLKPIAIRVEIIDIDDERIVSRELLERTLDGLSILHEAFVGIKPGYKYLVFGSFSVVETFLREYNE